MSHQYGAISFTQAQRCGLTRHQVKHRVASGRWLRPIRGVFAVSGSPETWQQRLMVVLLASRDAVASHLTAAAVHGLWRPPAEPHVIVPETRSIRLPVARVHRSRLLPGDRATVDGLRTTSATRMLVDSASLLDRRALEGLVDDTFCQRLSCVEAVQRSLQRLDHRGRSGSRLLAEVVGAWTPGIVPGSPAEMRLLRLLAEWGYGRPRQQVDVYAADGTFIGRLDLAWVRRRVGFEYDSDRFHNPRHWEANEARYAAFGAAGWTVLSVGKPDLMPSSDLNARLGRVLRRAAA